jgi:hypothetical protein
MRSIAGIVQLSPQVANGRRQLIGQIGPHCLNGQTSVIARDAQGTQVRAKILTMHARSRPITILGEMRVADQRAHRDDILWSLLVAQHVEKIDKQQDRGAINPAHGFGALAHRVKKIAFAALQRFDHERESVLFGQRSQLSQDLHKLLEGGGGGIPWRRGTRPAAADNHQSDAARLRAPKNRRRMEIPARWINIPTSKLQVGWKQKITCGHAPSAAIKGGPMFFEIGFRFVWNQKLHHQAFNVIEALPSRQVRQRGQFGRMKADAYFHGTGWQRGIDPTVRGKRRMIPLDTNPSCG